MVGYARVSTVEQTVDPQIDALKRAGCSPIFQEHASGGSRTRPELRRALEAIRAGDTLVVIRIDRLARSLTHLLEIVEGLEAKGAHFKSLGDPIDTGSPQGRLTLQILGAMAEFERALIRERTREGLEAARLRGRVGGNPGLRQGDPEAIRAVAAARDERRSQALAAQAQDFLPLVRDLRPGYSWDRVVLVLNARKIGRPGDGGLWTRDALIRAVRRLVRDGLAEPGLLDKAPRTGQSDDLVEIVAVVANALPKPTLGAIAAHLERHRIRAPRGGTSWGPSSVKHLLDQAKAKGLVPMTGDRRA